jgi:hypothetical protein
MEKWQKQFINGMYGIKPSELKMVSYSGRGQGKSTVARIIVSFVKQQELMNQCKEKGYTLVTIGSERMTTKNHKEMIDWCTQNCKKDFASFVAYHGIFMFEDEEDATYFAMVW